MYKNAEYHDGVEDESGRLAEFFALGEIRQTEAYIKEFKKVANERKYVSWKDSVRLVRRFSPYNPTDPHDKPFLNDLRIAIIDALGFTEEKDVSRVKIYTALGSPLDVWHGIDALVEIEDGNGRTSKFIGLDVFNAQENSEAEEKRKHIHDRKADVMIFMKDISDANTDSKKYVAKMDEIGQKAVKVLKTKESVSI